jgi:hypothetical protein
MEIRIRIYRFYFVIGFGLSRETAEKTVIAKPQTQARAVQSPVRPRIQSPSDRRPVIKPVGGGECCTRCGTVLVVSKGGRSLYCPNFKDQSQGDHSRVPAPGAA